MCLTTPIIRYARTIGDLGNFEMVTECAIFHSNRYHAGETCEQLHGGIRREPWCITCNALVRYAYEIMIEPGTLKLADQLILHALGVEWPLKSAGGIRLHTSHTSFANRLNVKK